MLYCLLFIGFYCGLVWCDFTRWLENVLCVSDIFGSNFRTFSAATGRKPVQRHYFRRASLSALRIGVESTSSGRGNAWLFSQRVHGYLPLHEQGNFLSQFPPTRLADQLLLCSAGRNFKRQILYFIFIVGLQLCTPPFLANDFLDALMF